MDTFKNTDTLYTLDKKYTLPTIHISIWLCLFFYPFMFHHISFTDVRTVCRMFVLITFVLIFFYSNTHIFIPKFLAKRSFLTYFILILGSLSLIAFSSGYLQWILNPEYDIEKGIYNTSFNTGIVFGLFAWVVSSGIKITSEWFKNQQLMKSAENERLQAQLNFLKSQVNPHFLFNALNNIYSLEHKHSPDTGSAILKLSELTRYMLHETSSEFVPLQKEIDYIRNYIELQKLGISKEVKIDLEVDGTLDNLKIEPMLLLPLIENTFKHGISYVNHSFIKINITIKNKQLELMTVNKVGEKEKRNGFGLTNLRKRLDLLYPGKYELDIKKTDGEFISYLKLQLK